MDKSLAPDIDEGSLVDLLAEFGVAVLDLEPTDLDIRRANDRAGDVLDLELKEDGGVNLLDLTRRTTSFERFGTLIDAIRERRTCRTELTLKDPERLVQVIGQPDQKSGLYQLLLAPLTDPSPSIADTAAAPPAKANGKLMAIPEKSVAADAAAGDLTDPKPTRWSPITSLEALIEDGIYRLELDADCRLRLVHGGAAFERLTGYDADKLDQSGGWFSLIEPGDLDLVKRRNLAVLAGANQQIEYEIRSRTGERRRLIDHALPDRDDDGQIIGICGLLREASRQETAPSIAPNGSVPHDMDALARLAGDTVLRVRRDGTVAQVLVQGSINPGEPWVAGTSVLSAVHQRDRSRLDTALLEQNEQDPPVDFMLTLADPSDPSPVSVTLAAASDDLLISLKPMQLPDIEGPSLGLHEAPAHFEALSGRPQTISDDWSLILDQDGHIRRILAAPKDMADTAEGWLHRPFKELVVGDGDQEALARAYKDLSDGIGSVRLWLHIMPEPGPESLLLWRIAIQDEGDRQRLIVRGEQVPQPVAHEQSLDQVRLAAIMDHVADGIVTIDVKGVIESFSRSAELLFGYPDDEIIARPIDTLLAGNGDEVIDVLRSLRDLAAGAEETTTDFMGRRASGELFPLELSVREVQIHGGTTYILTLRDITSRKQTEETIRRLHYNDPLTGLPNKLLFNDRLDQAVERAKRNPQQFAVMLLDLDRFKLINESLGHAQGDQILKRVAERLTTALRKSDTVARLGGDEFLLLLPGTQGAEGAARVGQKVLDALKPLVDVNGQEVNVSASIGIALYPHDGDDREALLRNADTALARAKEQGRNTYQFYTNDMNARAFERLVLETQLRKALERNELVVYFQPQLSMQTGEITGVEALVRWFHPELGRIPPAEFIPLAEETGLIMPVGQWVLHEACRRVRTWHEAGFGQIRLAVNLSSRQFRQRNLVEVVDRVLKDTQMPAAMLELEITESALMEDVSGSIQRLKKIDELGVQLAVDDFGTGYSSLAYLKRFPIRCLKIDKGFVQDITTDPNDAAIAQAVVALGEMLNLKVVAEGVETQEQLALLKTFGCHEMQGYLFSRPLPSDELLSLLQEGRKLTLAD